MTNQMNSQSGVAALMTVVIVAAAALIIAQSAALLGIGELDLGYTAQRGAEALSVADGCMEETLHRIRLNTSYGVGAGDINLTVTNGSCVIAVIDLGSNQRRVTVTGTSGDYNKKIEVTLTLSGTAITIDSWEEKSD